MLCLVWTPEALADRQTTVDYIADRNLPADKRLQALIEYMAEQLPIRRRPGRVLGTRQALVHPNHILVYRVDADILEILAVLRARQRYP